MNFRFLITQVCALVSFNSNNLKLNDIPSKQLCCMIEGSSNGWPDYIDTNLKNGADLYESYYSELQLASKNGQVDVVRLLLEKRIWFDKIHDLFFKYACLHGFTDAVETFLHNLKINHENLNLALESASENGHVGVVELLLLNMKNSHGHFDYAQEIGFMHRYIYLIIFIREKGENVSTSLESAIEWAKKKGNNELITLLTCNPVNNFFANYNSALRYANENGHADLAKLLINNRKNVHVGADLALELASQKGHAKVVKLLLEKKDNVYASVDFALELASENGQADVVKILLEKGGIAHKSLDLALKLAWKNGHADVAKLLSEHVIKLLLDKEIII